MPANNSPVANLNRDVSVGTFAQGGGGQPYATSYVKEALFQAAGAAGVYTARLSLPAGSRITDMGCDGIALWTAGTSAGLIVGSDADDDCFFALTDLKATDLLAGEQNTIEHPGGKAGVAIGSEQRVLYYPGGVNVVAKITTVGTTSLVGTTRVWVEYAVSNPRIVNATYVAT